MLNKSYNIGIVGQNYLSIIQGIIALKTGSSAVIIDDLNLSFANKWYLNIGLIEREILEKIGQKYEIPALIDISRFLRSKPTILYLNEKVIELGDSPFYNIKEIARKLPDCFGKVFTEAIEDISAEVFDNDFKIYINSIVKKSAEIDLNPRTIAELFDQHKNLELTKVLEQFLAYLEKDTLSNKQLHYILQVMFQAVVSPKTEILESKYLLTSLISERFEVKFRELNLELVEQFKRLGGDIKRSSVKDWGIGVNSLEYLLLESIDGIIKVNNTKFYGQVRDSLPFYNISRGTRFLSINLLSQIDHDLVPFFKNKRIVFSQDKRMGSDFPYWEVSIDSLGVLSGIYAFADYQGSKASFYYHQALEDIFHSLEQMLPGLEKADWLASTKLSQGSDIWFEVPSERKSEIYPFKPDEQSNFYIPKGRSPLQGIELCGPNCTKSLGLSSYLLENFY